MRTDLENIRWALEELAEKEATYLYRLARRMEKHGCDPKMVRKCRDEAGELHLTGYPERLVDWRTHYRFEYAFKQKERRDVI